MINVYKPAIAALLSEYQRALDDVKIAIRTIDDAPLMAIADIETLNDDCRSIATILTHVVGSGYSYCVYIRRSFGAMAERPERKLLATAEEYCIALDSMFEFTVQTFEKIEDDQLEMFEECKKIRTAWGQIYDIEQLFEHAIVHVLRHRRQIDKFKKLLT